MAGPAFSAAASPVRLKMPAPMIAPMPSVVRFVAESVRFSSFVSASAFSAAIDLRAHRFAISAPLFGFVGKG